LEVLPHFAPAFFNLIGGQRDAQVRPKTFDAFERFSWCNVFAQALGVLQKLLLFFRRERPHGFQDGLFEGDHTPSIHYAPMSAPSKRGRMVKVSRNGSECKSSGRLNLPAEM
jgi:hypothetical protein